MKQLIPYLLAALSCIGAPAMAQSPVVVELFTSQGCSSCPPADKLMHELAKRDDVIALALHVDYWDYIGWKDEFADPKHAERQRGYAVEAGRRSVYTPQMIINGVTDIVGARPMELSKAIAEHAANPAPVALEVVRAGSRVTISADAVSAEGPFLVHMLRYQSERTARITRGENAGHTLSYANVTEDWKILAEWDGVTTLAMDAVAEGDNPVVVMVQKGRHGPILAAAQLR
ncbi:thioredoxin family protein [uncultured Tateyamaria sp.]|uniref:DUF1223 domain-containing protein n=1 Tax=uncultured Tateyamaria sp. TaxID=455651 RepID=UPI00260CE7C1|nr:DUF1223 domain-containing protein [uncultured Tateyamaria sp.]